MLPTSLRSQLFPSSKLPEEAVHTAQLVELIDSLFDSFNSRFYKDKKALKRPLTKTSTHATFLI